MDCRSTFLKLCIPFLRDLGTILTLCLVNKSVEKYLWESDVFKKAYFRLGSSTDPKIRLHSFQKFLMCSPSKSMEMCTKLVVGSLPQYELVCGELIDKVGKDEVSRFAEYYNFFLLNRDIQYRGRIKPTDWYDDFMWDASPLLDRMKNVTKLFICPGSYLEISSTTSLRNIRSIVLFEVIVHLSQQFKRIEEITMHDCRIICKDCFVLSPNLSTFSISYGGTKNHQNDYFIHPPLPLVCGTAIMKDIKREPWGPDPSFAEFCADFKMGSELKNQFEISMCLDPLVTKSLSSNSMKNIRKLEVRKIYHKDFEIKGEEWIGMSNLEEVVFEFILIGDCFFQKNEFTKLKVLYLIGTCVNGIEWKPMPRLEEFVFASNHFFLSDDFFQKHSQSFRGTLKKFHVFGTLGSYFSNDDEEIKKCGVKLFPDIDKSSIITHSVEEQPNSCLLYLSDIPKDKELDKGINSKNQQMQIIDLSDVIFTCLDELLLNHVKVVGWEYFSKNNFEMEELELNHVTFGYFKMDIGSVSVPIIPLSVNNFPRMPTNMGMNHLFPTRTSQNFPFNTTTMGINNNIHHQKKTFVSESPFTSKNKFKKKKKKIKMMNLKKLKISETNIYDEFFQRFVVPELRLLSLTYLNPPGENDDGFTRTVSENQNLIPLMFKRANRKNTGSKFVRESESPILAELRENVQLLETQRRSEPTGIQKLFGVEKEIYPDSRRKFSLTGQCWNLMAFDRLTEFSTQIRKSVLCDILKNQQTANTNVFTNWMNRKLNENLEKTHFFVSNFGVKGFRNYYSENQFPFSSICAIVGQNGSGKTNLLVSLYHLALSPFFDGNLNHCEPYNISIRPREKIFESNVVVKNARMKLNLQTPTSVRIPDNSSYSYFFELSKWNEIPLESGDGDIEEEDEDEDEDEELEVNVLYRIGIEIDNNVKSKNFGMMNPMFMYSPQYTSQKLSTSEREMKMSYSIQKNTGKEKKDDLVKDNIEIPEFKGKILYFNSSFQVHIAKDRKTLMDGIMRIISTDFLVLLYFTLVLDFFDEFVNFVDVNLQSKNEDDMSLYFSRDGNEVEMETLTDGEICLINYILITTSLICQNYDCKIILLDEPEAHLHPSLTNILFKFLNRISEEYKIQVICTTHSDTFSRNFDIRNVLHLENGEFFRVRSVEDYDNAMHKLGYRNHGKLDTFTRLSRTYHVRRMTIVEGVTDVEFLLKLLKILSSFKDPLLMKLLKDKIEFTIFKNPDSRPVAENIQKRKNEITETLKSLLAIQNVNSPFIDGKMGGVFKPIKKDPLLFLVICDQDIKTKENLENERLIYKKMENVSCYISSPREMESYLLLMYWKLYKDDINEVDKISKLGKFAMEYHKIHFKKSSWMEALEPEKGDDEGKKEKKMEKKKKKGMKITEQTILVSSAKPLNNDVEKIEEWLMQKGISSETITETDVDENLLSYVDPKTALAVVFGNKRKYLKLCLKKLANEPKLQSLNQNRIRKYIPQDLKNFIETLLKFYFKKVEFVIGGSKKEKIGQGYVISDHKENVQLYVENLFGRFKRGGDDRIEFVFGGEMGGSMRRISKDKDFFKNFFGFPTYKMIYIKRDFFQKSVEERYLRYYNDDLFS